MQLSLRKTALKLQLRHRWYPHTLLTFHFNGAFCVDLTRTDGLCKQLCLHFCYTPEEALEVQWSAFFKIIPLCHPPALSVRGL